MNENPTPPTACAAFEATVQLVLDGEAPSPALNAAHTFQCVPCAEIAAAARLLLTGLESQSLPTPPAGFVDRVVPVVIAEGRRRDESRWTYRIAACSVAASALVAFFASSPWQPAEQPLAAKAPATSTVAVRMPSVTQSIADARMAVLALTRRAASESMSPAKSLFASLDVTPPTPTPVPPPASEVSSPVEPITNTAKRALNLFIRDVSGLSPIPQMKS